MNPDPPVRRSRRGGSEYQLPPHLKAARQESQDLLVMLVYTGGRWSEVGSLRWDQVNLTTGRIRLWGNKVARERITPIAGPLRAVLERRRGSEGEAVGLVFPGRNGQQRAQPSDAIGEAMDGCGLNRSDLVAKYGPATVHSLRHTFASWLVQRGAALNEVQDALGHANIASTVRYAHLEKEETLKKLQALLED